MFYKLKKTASHNAVLNFVLSSRGEGKTTEALRQSIKDWREHGYRFVLIRRTKDEGQAIRKVIFDDLVELKVVKTGEFYTYGSYIYQMPQTKEGKPELCGYLLSINVDASRKSRKFMNIRNIIYDEFIPENNKYIPNEQRLFVSLITTIIRYNEKARIFCLANTITAYSPYFETFGLVNNPDLEFIKSNNNQALIHNFRSEGIRELKKQQRWYKLLDDTIYGKYVNDNVPLLDNNSFITLLKEPSKEAIYSVIATSDFSFTLWFSNRKNITWICPGIAKTCQIYNITNTIRNATNIRASRVLKKLEDMLSKGSVFFDSLETKKKVELCLNLNRGRE